MSKATAYRCNEQIRISPVRIIGPENEQHGVMETFEAMRMAREAGLDLVEIAPNERPPVCKLMDYGKFKYMQKKHKQKHHEQQLKEVRLRPKTDDHDREIKLNHALKFLAEGDKVQFTMQFRGRERAHRDLAFDCFNEISQLLADLVKVERPPRMDGKVMIMVVAPNKPGFDRMIKDKVDLKVPVLRERLAAAQASKALAQAAATAKLASPASPAAPTPSAAPAHATAPGAPAHATAPSSVPTPSSSAPTPSSAPSAAPSSAPSPTPATKPSMSS